MQLIYPERKATSPEELASELRLHELAPPDRPYLGLNMVSSLDGKATLDWRTKGLSTEVDRRLFHHLRTQADAVMVGAGTVREERYGRMTKNDELRDKRVAEGRTPEALAVVVSGRLDLPADLPLLNEPEQSVLIATGAEHSLADAHAGIEYARVGDDLPRLMADLHERGRPFGAVRGRPDAELVPVRGRPRGRAVPDDEPEGRGRRGRAHDRRGARAGGAGGARSGVGGGG